jgi:hypothetical protein
MHSAISLAATSGARTSDVLENIPHFTKEFPMKRLVFPLILAAISLCHSVSAQSPGRTYMTRMPTLLTSSEKAATTGNIVSPPVAGGYAGGYGGVDQSYGFGSNNCGCSTGCCDNVWSGYVRGCGIHGHHGKHGGGCNTCGPVGCGGGCGGCGGGGCFGNTFAGGCGGCGLGFGHKMHHACGGFLHHCKGLFHGLCGSGCGCGDGGMFYSGGSSCGCGGGANFNGGNGVYNSNAQPTLSNPPAPPAENVPAAEGTPATSTGLGKSAQRPVYSRPYGVFPSSW